MSARVGADALRQMDTHCPIAGNKRASNQENEDSFKDHHEKIHSATDDVHKMPIAEGQANNFHPGVSFARDNQQIANELDLANL